MTLYLTESDVEQLLTMPDAMRVVEDAFRDLGQGRAINRPRQRLRVPNGILHMMPAGLPARGYIGFKYYSSFRPKTDAVSRPGSRPQKESSLSRDTASRFWFHLLDANTGELLAVIQADRLGQRRTGAASGVAAQYLARSDASAVGLIGTGWQAESQLEAICAARKIRIARCHSRDAEHRKKFAVKMSAQLEVDVRGVDSAEEAVRNADIVITATNSREPVLRGEWLSPGAHINAIGSNRAEAREIDDATVTRASLIAVDSTEQAKIESGDLLAPIERGILAWERVSELGEIVAGKIPGRTRPDSITLFKSNGIALEDVAVGAFVYERAREQKIGRDIEL